MPQAKLEVGTTLRTIRLSFEEHRPLILRLTFAFAALNAASVLLDVAGPAGFALSLGITLLLGAIYSGMITALICLPGKADGSGQLWAAVKPVLARLIWVTLVVAFAVVLGLIALIVPGLVILTFWAVAGQAVVVEQAPVFKSLGRSYGLVKDTAWRVFGYLVCIGLLSLLLAGLALLVAAPLGTGLAANLVGSFLSNLLSTPVLAIGSAVLYNGLTDLQRPAEPEAADSDPPDPLR